MQAAPKKSDGNDSDADTEEGTDDDKQEEVDNDDADTTHETVLERHRRLVLSHTTKTTTNTNTTDNETVDAAELSPDEPDV